MRVLVVGGGGREHAVAWKLSQSPGVTELFVAPGNPGTEEIATNLPIKATEIDELIAAAEHHQIDLTVVGPEDPLAAGIVDRFQERGLTIAGPTQAASRIESSKIWAKDVMHAAGVPTARSEHYEDFEEARAAVVDMPLPIVIKADGLALGKGVAIAQSHQDAVDILHDFMVERTLGAAGSSVLLEEFLVGLEVSVIGITDGTTILPLIPTCDYKRAFDGDHGPNTGGVGAYGPVPSVDPELMVEITRTILQPTIDQLRALGTEFRGVLFAGMILTPDGPRVMEFNCRFGDPETQIHMAMLESDLGELLLASASGDLSKVEPPRWKDGYAVGVVLSSGGYPGGYRTGEPINGIESIDSDLIVFHAGTSRDEDGTLVTSGGRVLMVTAVKDSISEARDAAYRGVSQIRFNNAQFRTDIAAREIGYERVNTSPAGNN